MRIYSTKAEESAAREPMRLAEFHQRWDKPAIRRDRLRIEESRRQRRWNERMNRIL